MSYSRALLLERVRPNERIDSLIEFLEFLRDSVQHTLTEVMDEHPGLKIYVGLDGDKLHMFDEPIASGHLNTNTTVLNNDFQIHQVLLRLGEEVQMRKANFIRNGRAILLDNIDPALLPVC